MIYGSCGREGVGTKLYREPELTLGGPSLVPPRKCLLEAKVASVEMYPPTPLSHASVSKILGSKQVAIAYARPHGHQYHQETCVFASVLRRTYAQEVSALTPDGRREMLTGRTLTET